MNGIDYEKRYDDKMVITDQRAAWAFTDWLDDEVCKLCYEVAASLASDEHPLPDEAKFYELMYERSDVGGLRDAIIRGAEETMRVKLVFDYPF